MSSNHDNKVRRDVAGLPDNLLAAARIVAEALARQKGLAIVGGSRLYPERKEDNRQ